MRINLPRVRKPLAVLSILLAGISALQASPGILMPQEVFVGDTAEFSFKTTSLNSILAEGTLFTVPAEDFPSSKDLTVQSIVVFRNGDAETVTIRFVPWISGVLQIPAFEIKKIQITPPPVRIASLVDKTGRNALEKARSPLLIPGTTWILYAVIAAIIAAVALCAYACVKFCRYFIMEPGKRLAGKRVRLFLRDMKMLERDMERQGISVWYASFASALRRYFGAFCSGNLESFMALTGPEIVYCVREKIGGNDGLPGGFDAGLSERVAGFVSGLDRVRFSGTDDGDRRSGDLAIARDLVTDLEAVLAVIAGREEVNAQP